MSDAARGAEELLKHIHLANIRPVAVSAQLLSGPEGSITGVRFNQDIQYAAGPEHYANRFSYHFDVMCGDSVDPCAKIDFTLLVQWQVEAGYTPDAEAADYLSGSTAYFMAFPHVRELLMSLLVRIVLDPIVLGALRQEELVPGVISLPRQHTELLTVDSQ